MQATNRDKKMTAKESGGGIIKSGGYGIIISLMIVLVMGCAVPQPRPVPQKELSEIDPNGVLKRETQVLTPGPPPFTEKVSPVGKDIQVAPQLYSLVFDQASMGDVVVALTRDTDLNLSIESEVDLAKKVTVHLKNVTLEEAMDSVVVNGAGYAWSLENGMLRIKRFQERIYQLDQLDLIGETAIDVGGDMLASSVDEAGVTGKYQIKAERTKQTSDLWTSVLNTLEGLKSEEGSIRTNRNSGIIYMVDTPRRVSSMVRFLDSLSESLNRQVFIEAKIMEVFLTDESRYGIDWTKLNIQFKSDWGIFPDVFELNFNSDGSIIKGDISSLRGVLDFLKTQGDITVLANPHISVMNRQSAVLTVGFQFPYADIDGIDRDLDTGFVTIGTTIKRSILGLQLGITPQISKDGIITFHIVPVITRIDREVPVEIPIFGASSQVIDNPVIDLQELSTTVRVREGNSFVLAGLIQKIKQLNHEGLPVLGDIPYLGTLFKRIEEKEENKELVIVVTPYIKEIG
jgi:type II secretory pathway component GspD/PulD (secretin)